MVPPFSDRLNGRGDINLTNTHYFLGGPGCGNLETALIIEALAYGCSAIQLAIMGPSLALAPLLLAGTEEQKKRYAGMLAEEPLIAVSFLRKILK